MFALLLHALVFQAKDIYGNLRLTGGDNFKVRLTGVDSTAGLVQDLAPSVPGKPLIYRGSI